MELTKKRGINIRTCNRINADEYFIITTTRRHTTCRVVVQTRPNCRQLYGPHERINLELKGANFSRLQRDRAEINPSPTLKGHSEGVKSNYFQSKWKKTLLRKGSKAVAFFKAQKGGKCSFRSNYLLKEQLKDWKRLQRTHSRRIRFPKTRSSAKSKQFNWIAREISILAVTSDPCQKHLPDHGREIQPDLKSWVKIAGFLNLSLNASPKTSYTRRLKGVYQLLLSCTCFLAAPQIGYNHALRGTVRSIVERQSLNAKGSIRYPTKSRKFRKGGSLIRISGSKNRIELPLARESKVFLSPCFRSIVTKEFSVVLCNGTERTDSGVSKCRRTSNEAGNEQLQSETSLLNEICGNSFEKSENLTTSRIKFRHCDITGRESNTVENTTSGGSYGNAGIHRIRKRESCIRYRTINQQLLRHWLIMASVVWWCYDTANCVQMEQNGMNCPTDCECYNDLMNIMCDNRGFRMVPPGIPETARKLMLANNNIRDLPINIFRNSTVLEELILRDNYISKIPTRFFYGLVNLKVLDLSGNQMVQVPAQALSYLGSLREIRIRNNPIEELLTWNFIQVRETLTALDLGQLTKLNYISNTAFRGLNNLQFLKMDSCGLTKMPSLSPLLNVEEIDLSSNRFGIVPETAFRRMAKLRRLNLSNCRLKRIPFGTFDDLESLQELTLAQNNLTSLAEDSFYHNELLSTVELQNNPWMCNCDLIYLAEWLWDNKNSCTDQTCPICRYPRTYKGMLVSKLVDIESPPCALPIISNAVTNINVSAGTGVKIPCPTVAPTAETTARYIYWNLPDGSKIQNKDENETRVQTIQRNNYQVSVRIKLYENGALNISKVTLEDSGTYVCSVATTDGSYANSTVYLNVTNGGSGLQYSFFTTETTIISNKNSKRVKQQPTPPRGKTLPTKPSRQYPRIASTTPRVKTTLFPAPYSRSPFTTTAPSNGPMFNPPSSPPTTTNVTPGSSVTQVMETTKIIIGCFIGITLIAAALLVVFYKMRKKKYPRGRCRVTRPTCQTESKFTDQTGYGHNMEISTTQTNLIGRMGDEHHPFVSEPISEINTGQNTASLISLETNQGMQLPSIDSYWRDSRQPLLTKESKDNEENESIVTPQILPPPPEEMFYDGKIEPFVTTASLINMTSQSNTTEQSSVTSQSKQQSSNNDTPEKMGPLEQGYDSLKFMKQMMPPAMKPINGTSRLITSQDNSQIPMSISQRELLNDLASSCQKVALSRNSKNPPDQNYVKGQSATLRNVRTTMKQKSSEFEDPKIVITQTGQYPRFSGINGGRGFTGNHTIDSATWKSYMLENSERFQPPPPSGLSRRYGSTYNTQVVGREQNYQKLHNSSLNLAQIRPQHSKPQGRPTSSRLINTRPSSASFLSHSSNDGELSPLKLAKGNYGNRCSRTVESVAHEKQMLQRKIPIKLGSLEGVMTHKETEI